MANKEKRPMEISPTGVVIYAHLEKPQPPHPKNKSKDAKAKYNIEILMPINDPKIQKWGASVKAILPDSHYPLKKDMGDKNRKATGELRVKFASEFVPRIVDAKRNALPPGRFPAAGSMVKVAYVASPYDTGSNKGVTLYLQGIQVLKLVEFERKALPFTDEEGFERDPDDKGVAEHAAGALPEDAEDRLADEEPPSAGPDEDDGENLPF